MTLQSNRYECNFDGGIPPPETSQPLRARFSQSLLNIPYYLSSKRVLTVPRTRRTTKTDRPTVVSHSGRLPRHRAADSHARAQTCGIACTGSLFRLAFPSGYFIAENASARAAVRERDESGLTQMREGRRCPKRNMRLQQLRGLSSDSHCSFVLSADRSSTSLGLSESKEAVRRLFFISEYRSRVHVNVLP